MRDACVEPGVNLKAGGSALPDTSPFHESRLGVFRGKGAHIILIQ